MFWYVSSHHQVLTFKNFSEYLQLQVGVSSDRLLENNNYFLSMTVPKPLPKLVIHRMPSSAACNIQYFLFSLRSSSSCFRHYPRLPFTVILPSFLQPRVSEGSSNAISDHSSQPSFFLLFVVCSFPPPLFVTLLHFSHDRSNRSLSYSSTTFENFLGISDLLSEVYILLTPYLLTPQSLCLLEKLIGLQVVKKIPKFYGTRKFITTYTSARHLSLSWASSDCTKVSVQIRGKCSCFVTKLVFTVSSQQLAQPSSWRTTPCRLSTTAYSIYLQLPSVLEAVPPSTT